MCVTGATQAPTGSHFGATNHPFVATYISCAGSEAQLSDCFGFTAYQSYAKNCQSTRAAGAVCLTLEGGPPPIRLVGGDNNHEGRVEIYIQVSHSSTFFSLPW